jgi:hypothetical protein
MNIRKTLYLLSTVLGLVAIVAGMSVFVSCRSIDEAGQGIAPANTCPAIGEEREEGFNNMVVSSETKREKPLIDVNAPVNVETATFALG